MFSMCSELAPRAHIPDTRIPQLMQPCLWVGQNLNRCCIGGREVGCTSSGVCGRVVGRCIGGQGGGAQVVEVHVEPHK